MKNSQKLTIREAYDSMVNFLEKYFEKTNSDDIGSLLGGMLFSDDGSTLDPAAWQDWELAVKKISNQSTTLSPNAAHSAMIAYLEQYYENTGSDETKMLIELLMNTIENEASTLWQE